MSGNGEAVQKFLLWVLNAVWGLAIVLGITVVDDLREDVKALRERGERIATLEAKLENQGDLLRDVDQKVDRLLEEKR